MKGSIGLGCWALGGDSYGKVTEGEAKEVLQKAYDLGVRFYDTSPSYGSGLSESRIGRYLAGKNDVFIATKVGMLPHSDREIPYDFSRNHIFSSVETSLSRLKRERLDLLQLHSPIDGFEIEYPDIFETLRSLLDSSKVAKIGISLRSPRHIETQAKLFEWQSFQFNLSLVDQRIKVGLTKAKVSDSILIARTPLNFGFLTNNPPDIARLGDNNHLKGWDSEQLFTWNANAKKLRQLFSHIGVSLLNASLRFPIDSGLANIVIPGARNSTELTENWNAFHSEALSDDLLTLIFEYYGSYLENPIQSPYKYVRSPNLK